MNPEDRLTAMMTARAGAARTSPDALDHVFGRVARHRRNVRLATGAGAVLTVAALAVGATTLRGGEQGLQPTTPSASAPAGSPTATPTGSPTAAPPSPTTPAAPPDDRAVVVLSDGRIAEISTTTGAEVRSIGRVPGRVEPDGLAWSPDRSVVYYVVECRVFALPVGGGAAREVAQGQAPAVSPDGSQLAVTECGSGRGLRVVDLAGGRVTTYAGFSDDPDDFFRGRTFPVDVAWYDDHRLLVAVAYEGNDPVVVLDTRTDRSLDDARQLREVVPARVAARHGTAYGLEDCCYPEHDRPEEVSEFDVTSGSARRATTFPGQSASLTVDAAGTLLTVNETGVWRWRGAGPPTLVRRGAIAVAG